MVNLGPEVLNKTDERFQMSHSNTSDSFKTVWELYMEYFFLTDRKFYISYQLLDNLVNPTLYYCKYFLFIYYTLFYRNIF